MQHTLAPDTPLRGDAAPSTAGSEPVVHLQCGALHAHIAPQAGGSLAALFSQDTANGAQRHWLRPASARTIAERDPLGMASFPLLPWANRLRNGRFTLDGRTVQLPPHPALGPHAIHGLGWGRAWQVASQSRRRLVLELAHDGSGPWPYAFSARQIYSLDAQGLRIDMSLRNRGTERMPAGLGHHPYLPHERHGTGTRLKAHVQGMWESDAELLPTRLSSAHPAVRALCSGMQLQAFDLDNNFTGFGREAEVLWPDGDRLFMQSTAPMDYFVLYCPQGEDIFCMEPVSNCTDWLNLPPDTNVGGHLLEPGQTLQGSLSLQPAPNRRRQGTATVQG